MSLIDTPLQNTPRQSRIAINRKKIDSLKRNSFCSLSASELELDITRLSIELSKMQPKADKVVESIRLTVYVVGPLFG